MSVFIGNNAHAATISAPSDLIITQGQTGAVPISVTNGGSGIVGADVTLQFDSSVIEVFGSGSSAIQQSGFATDGWITEQNVVSVSGTTKELGISATPTTAQFSLASTTIEVTDPVEITISATLENTTEQGRGKNRRAEMAFVLPKLFQIALHGRWEASGDRNADLLRSDTADSEDVGACLESKEDIEIKQLMSGAYPEHMSLEVGARSATKAYVTAQSFGVDSLGAPQSALLSWEALGRGRVLDVWGAEVRSAGAPARTLQGEAAVNARWAPAPYRAASHWWLERVHAA